VSGLLRELDDEKLILRDTEPPQFTRVPFPVKALKLLLHELQTNGEAASMAVPTAPLDTKSDDGDSDWSDEEKVKDDRNTLLADLIGVGGMPFDEDEVLANNDDEDLQKDPVSQIDLRVREMNCWPFPNPDLSDFGCTYRRPMSRHLFARARRAMRMDLGSLLGN
jgi:hypothetical protein